MKNFIKKLKGRNIALTFIGILVMSLIIMGISNTYSYYEDKESDFIFSSRVGNFIRGVNIIKIY